MKKCLLSVIIVVLSIFLFSCSDDDSIKEYSQETAVSDINFTELICGVKISFTEKVITLAISRSCPETVLLDAKLPDGAKIISVSEGLELMTDSTFKATLKISEQFFVIQAEDDEVIERYSVNIEKDKVDLALHLIEQTLYNESLFTWKHERNEQGTEITSKLVNRFNEKNFKTYTHQINEAGYITKTSFTTYEHKQYSYSWKYDDDVLTSYDKKKFNKLPSHHFLHINDDNLIVKLVEKNDFDYVLDEIDFTYDEKNRIATQKGVSLTYDQVYTYDDKNRVISSGENEYKYDSYGNTIKINFVSDHYEESEDRVFDTDGNIITLKQLRKDGSVGSEYTYSYFRSGKILKKEDLNGTNITVYNEDGSYINSSRIEFFHSRRIFSRTYDEFHNEIEYSREEVVFDFPSESYTEVQQYVRNSVGLILKRNYVKEKNDGSPSIITVTDYEYNNLHLLVKNITTSNDQFYEVNNKKYDSNGLVTESIYYDADNNKTKTYFYTYFKYGKVKTKIYDKITTGTVSETTWEYFGNWNIKNRTEKQTVNGVIQNEKLIEYYQDVLRRKRTEENIYEDSILVRKVVREYSKVGLIMSSITYDGDGNILDSQTFEENSIQAEQRELERNVRLES